MDRTCRFFHGRVGLTEEVVEKMVAHFRGQISGGKGEEHYRDHSRSLQQRKRSEEWSWSYQLHYQQQCWRRGAHLAAAFHHTLIVQDATMADGTAAGEAGAKDNAGIDSVLLSFGRDENGQCGHGGHSSRRGAGGGVGVGAGVGGVRPPGDVAGNNALLRYATPCPVDLPQQQQQQQQRHDHHHQQNATIAATQEQEQEQEQKQEQKQPKAQVVSVSCGSDASGRDSERIMIAGRGELATVRE